MSAAEAVPEVSSNLLPTTGSVRALSAAESLPTSSNVPAAAHDRNPYDNDRPRSHVPATSSLPAAESMSATEALPASSNVACSHDRNADEQYKPRSHVPEASSLSTAASVPNSYGVSSAGAMHSGFGHVPATSTVHDRDSDEHDNSSGKNN